VSAALLARSRCPAPALVGLQLAASKLVGVRTPAIRRYARPAPTLYAASGYAPSFELSSVLLLLPSSSHLPCFAFAASTRTAGCFTPPPPPSTSCVLAYYHGGVAAVYAYAYNIPVAARHILWLRLYRIHLTCDAGCGSHACVQPACSRALFSFF